jgi:hypothetical protein
MAAIATASWSVEWILPLPPGPLPNTKDGLGARANGLAQDCNQPQDRGGNKEEE